MAHALNVRNMLQRMGLSVEAATEVCNVNGQNLSAVDDFLQLGDKDIETLCRVIRRPGGVNLAGYQNQGMQVSAMAETNLKRMVFQMTHTVRVSRAVVFPDITLVVFVPYRRKPKWRRPIRTPPPCQLWTRRTGQRTLWPSTSTFKELEAIRSTH